VIIGEHIEGGGPKLECGSNFYVTYSVYNNIQCAPVEIIEAPVPPRTLKNGRGFGDQYDWYLFKNGITHAEASGKPVFALIHAQALGVGIVISHFCTIKQVNRAPHHVLPPPVPLPPAPPPHPPSSTSLPRAICSTYVSLSLSLSLSAPGLPKRGERDLLRGPRSVVRGTRSCARKGTSGTQRLRRVVCQCQRAY
jgi:hypothetical protein